MPPMFAYLPEDFVSRLSQCWLAVLRRLAIETKKRQRRPTVYAKAKSQDATGAGPESWQTLQEAKM